MNMHLRSVLCLATLAFCSLAVAQEAAKTRGGGVAPELEKRFRAYADALVKRDVATLDNIWAADYVFINPQGETVTKAQRLENVKSGKTEFKAINPQPEQTRMHGNVAIDVGRVRLEGTKYAGQESSGEYRYMNVWVKHGNDWKMAANQITLIKK